MRRENSPPYVILSPPLFQRDHLVTASGRGKLTVGRIADPSFFFWTEPIGNTSYWSIDFGRSPKRGSEYAVSDSHSGCQRTSNMVDRLMNGLTRFLYHGRGLRDHQSPSELRLRGWSLLQNFRPFAPRSN